MKFIEALKTSEEKRSEIFCYFLKFCIGVGVVLHVVPYFYNRALWVDEAMLASSICSRTLKNIVSSPLDFGQSAAIGWIYIEKILSCLFGDSELVLRIFQLFSSFGCMFLLYFIMRGRIKKHYVLLLIAIFSLTNRFIYYGNEVKPYMFDNFCCLLIMFLWQKFGAGKIKFWHFIVVCVFGIWFSFPAVFFIAACMMVCCVSALVRFAKTKETKSLLKILPCFVVLFSFVLNYALWLSGTSNNAGGRGYWENLRFPILPNSLSDIILIARMAWNFFAFYPDKVFAGILCILFVLWCARCIRTKCDDTGVLLPFVISFLLMLLASALGFYPVQDRLVQQWLIFVLIFAVFELNAIESNFVEKSAFSNHANNIPYLLTLMIFLAFVGANGCKMFFARGVYLPTSEVKPAVRYLEENLKESDSVYVFADSVPAFSYYFRDKDIPVAHQHSERPETDGRFILGKSYHEYFYQKPYNYDYKINPDLLKNEVNRILRRNCVYIFNSHGVDKIPYLIHKLEKHGSVEIKNSFFDVNLYYFQKDCALSEGGK